MKIKKLLAFTSVIVSCIASNDFADDSLKKQEGISDFGKTSKKKLKKYKTQSSNDLVRQDAAYGDDFTDNDLSKSNDSFGMERQNASSFSSFVDNQ